MNVELDVRGCSRHAWSMDWYMRGDHQTLKCRVCKEVTGD